MCISSTAAGGFHFLFDGMTDPVIELLLTFLVVLFSSAIVIVESSMTEVMEVITASLEMLGDEKCYVAIFQILLS